VGAGICWDDLCGDEPLWVDYVMLKGMAMVGLKIT